ncbi:WbqC-like protein family protein [Natronorubrum sediminis]|uniref:WbqC-like protein family protein n=1 Tax=Natronorubrum sediminis TaxID=640943 RepID=A0A1H6FKX8_9EURY|nr:WbqC family protein [Natronorubrum sediminis]SEH11032.1 WbqC-like protein family protein [Natronorubrum sediminis]
MTDMNRQSLDRDERPAHHSTQESSSAPAESESTTYSTGSGRQRERTVAIHQPNYLPWLGYFHKIQTSDVFVFLDDVEYTSSSWINRNKIKTPDGWSWLTVPVAGSSGEISSVDIANDDWRDTHRKSLRQNYGKASAFEEWWPIFDDVYAQSWDSLCELNIHLVRTIADHLDLECTFVRSSELDVDASKTDRIVRLCEEVDADRYFSGTGARSYLEHDRFEDADIALEYQSVTHPRYEQRFDEFVPQLSIADPLLNVGSAETTELLAQLEDP